MLHPSYSDLMEVVNSDVEPGEQPVVQSRYSIVIATSRRARQIIAGEQQLVGKGDKKPLSAAIEELYIGKLRIVTDEENSDEENFDYNTGINIVDYGEGEADEFAESEAFGQDEGEEEEPVEDKAHPYDGNEE